MSINGSRFAPYYKRYHNKNHQRPISRKALLFTFCLAVVGSLTFILSPPAAAKGQELPDFSTLAEQASPAVVNISTLSKPKRDRRLGYDPYEGDLPELLRRYFGIPAPDDRGAPSRPEQARPQSLGSGFIISKDGYVLTNNHVVEEADEIIVRMNNRSEYKAKLVGSDKKSDLALLKVDGKNLPVVKIGQSDKLKPGQWVFAIGSPFGFDYSVTKGIISALNRSLPTESYVPFIQTDVPINPGNSGGPLLNMQGEVIGINSQIYTRSGGFMGLSFAIPVDDAMDVATQLKERGHVARGWLGVIIQDVDRNLAESFGLNRPQGALLSQVLPDGPASKGGLLAGDIITHFNGREIKFSSDLPIAVGRAPIGKKVPVELVRRGKKKNLELVVGELPDEQAGGSVRDGILFDNRLGISVTNLDDALRARLFLSNKVRGVVVTEQGDGVGRAYGLRTGDVITQVNLEEVVTTKDYQDVVSRLPVDRTLSLRLIRDGMPGFITFRLTK